jgi:hypothetical protein
MRRKMTRLVGKCEECILYSVAAYKRHNINVSFIYLLALFHISAL